MAWSRCNSLDFGRNESNKLFRFAVASYKEEYSNKVWYLIYGAIFHLIFIIILDWNSPTSARWSYGRKFWKIDWIRSSIPSHEDNVESPR